MSLPQLSLSAARHLHLAAQGLLKKPRRRAQPSDILSTVQRMSLLQIDTINIVARSPYLVLFSRLGNYQPQWLDNALSQVVMRYPGVKLELVGYSGGGNIAALLAARRTDVRSLRTVAGNLDVAYVNALHHVTAMPDAVSAIDSASALRTLPQIHFSGDDDKTVPPTVARRFQRAVGGHCTQVDVVSGMAHGSDWAAIWPQLLAKALTPAGDHSSCVL